MNQRLFLFTNEGNYSQHTVAEVDVPTAEALKAEGKAVEISFGPYDELKHKAKQVHEDFLKKEKRIRNDKHPKYNVEGAREFELDQITKEYEAQSLAIQSEWNEKREAMVEQARRKSAGATVSITDKDKATAEQFVNRAMLQAHQANDYARLDMLESQLSKDISYLSDAQKTALQGQINKVVDVIQAKARERVASEIQSSRIVANTSNLYSAVSDVRDLDLLASKVTDYLPITATLEYSQRKIVRKRAQR